MQPLTIAAVLLSSVLATVNPATAQGSQPRDCLAQAATFSKEFDPPGYVRKANLPGVIVFLHGANQDGRSGWTHPSGAYWPAMLICDEAFKGFDIYVAEYVAAETDGFRLSRLVDGLLRGFDNHGVFAAHRQVIAVVRDLGGVIARELITTQPTIRSVVPLIAWVDPAGDSGEKSIASLIVRDRDGFARVDDHMKKNTPPDPAGPTAEIQCAVLGPGQQVKLVPRTYWTSECTSEPVELPGGKGSAWLPESPSSPLAAWLRRVLPPESTALSVASPTKEPPPTRTIKASGNSINVGCSEAAAGVTPVPFASARGEEVVLSVATVEDSSNLKSATARVVQVLPDQVLVEFRLVGLDRDWIGSCPGGGHGRIVVTIMMKTAGIK